MGKYKSKILIVAAIIVAAFVVGLFSCSITIVVASIGNSGISSEFQINSVPIDSVV